MNQNNIISIISQSNLADTPFFISLSNLPPESYVDIRMTIYNYYCRMGLFDLTVILL